MPYVERYPDGTIKTVCENPQPGYAEEFVEHAALPEPPRGDGTALILTALHERLSALENGQPLASTDEEDEGQPAASEIFTEEDVEALGAVAAEGESAASEPLLDTSDASLAASEAEPAAYPGIMTLPDELGARRNAVLAAIATEKLTRLKIATDPSRAAFLAERFAEYQNRGALSLEIDDMLLADYRAYLAMKDRQERITNYAMQLEQSALDGDMDRLEAMHVGLGEGWPT